MNWYIAKIVFRIISGDGSHHAQFDEQLRLISAIDECQAFEKATQIGRAGQDSFMNSRSEQVRWEFIDVAEIGQIGELTDGAELYYQIHEAPNAELYEAWAHHKSALLSIRN
ncbi:MAG TPA: DUF4288 domain-containing protein [Mucilaginibacter sp.]|nr:DUF4288 domain-containing protein [Mucilaginibacter sp.]